MNTGSTLNIGNGEPFSLWTNPPDWNWLPKNRQVHVPSFSVYRRENDLSRRVVFADEALGSFNVLSSTVNTPRAYGGYDCATAWMRIGEYTMGRRC